MPNRRGGASRRLWIATLFSLGSALLITTLWPAASKAEEAPAEKIRIVAAENVYGDVAAQIGGSDVEVLSILSNPNQDPHLFETSPSTVRAMSTADIVVYNGANYDPWMEKLLPVSRREGRTVILAADLVGIKAGDNPHVWYKLEALPRVAANLAAVLERRVPSHAALYRRNLASFEASFERIAAQTRAIAAAHKNTAVTATEPVFGYMAQALGFKMLNEDFQTAVMNNTEPSVSQVIAFEASLKSGKARILFYNRQVSDKTTERLMKLARDAKIPVVGVTETEPRGMTVQAWFETQLNDVRRALVGGTM